MLRGSAGLRHRHRRGHGAFWPSVLVTVVVLAGVIALTPGVTFARVRALVGLGEQRLRPVVAVRLHGPHTFETTQPGSSDPVSYDPCRPIHYVVNPEGAPADHREMVEEAVAEVSRATGFEFAYDGTTRDRDFVHRGDGFSVHEAPVLIGWATPQEVPALAGEVAGLGGSAYVERTPDHRTYVTGSVTLDRDEFIGLDALPGGYDALRAIVMHELAHVVGLGHVQDPAELMYDGHLQRTTFGPGDLEGLASLGAVDCL